MFFFNAHGIILMVLNGFATNNLRNLYKKILGNEGQFLTTVFQSGVFGLQQRAD